MFTPKPEETSELSINLRTLQHIEEEDILVNIVARLTKPEINVLYYERFNKKLARVYLVPVFTRLVVTRITAIDLEQDFGVIAGRLFITLRYKGIPKKYVNEVLDNLVITINDSECLKFCMREEIG